MTKKIGRWIHPKATELDMPVGILGPFIGLENGGVMTLDGNATRVSRDDGVSWSAPKSVYDGPKPGIPGFTGNPWLESIGDRMGWLLLRTHQDTLVLVYNDRSTFVFGWDDDTREPVSNVRGNVWSIRSLDGGETWTDRQMIMEGYCGALITMIQTSTGEIVVPVQRLIYDPGRHATSTYVSTDDGATWTSSNTIDLGGHGHHDGAFEATLAELKDGRLLMLIRTTLDRFWEAYSEDKGRSWRTIRPTDLDASNAPGYLARLSSGRLVFVWNRLYPDGENMAPRSSGSSTQAWSSNHRDELSISFSEDEGQSWSEPVVFARNPRHTGGVLMADGSVMRTGGISYPKIFERRPGELWITTGFQGRLRVSMQESDFIK